MAKYGNGYGVLTHVTARVVWIGHFVDALPLQGLLHSGLDSSTLATNAVLFSLR